MTARLISVIGPPAVGKTTLAEALADELPAELVREDYAGNPFLAQSYVGSPQARLPGQLYFLLSRVSQLWSGNRPTDGPMITDYGFCQDAIFARLRLDEADFRMYGQVLGKLEHLVRRPDLLIHLDAAEDTLLGRIAARGRSFERAMDTEFLAAIRVAYNEVADMQGCPVVRVDCERVDLANRDSRSRLIEQIREAVG